MVKNRAKLHHEKPCKEKCKENNFAQNPHENNHALQRQKQPKRWFAPLEIFPPQMKMTLCLLSDTFAIAKFSANVSHPPSLHAVWKTVSCDEVAEHSLKRFGSLPFIGGGCYLRLVASVKLRFGTDKRHDI